MIFYIYTIIDIKYKFFFFDTEKACITSSISSMIKI